MTPSVVLLFCASPRTGSGLLCSTLWETGLAGRPDEYLEPRARAGYESKWGRHDDPDYFRRVLEFGTTANGVFSAKIHAEQLPHRMAWRAITPLIPSAAADVRFFWLRRRDRVRQAVSLYRAHRSGRFTLRGHEPRPVDPVPYDYARISACLRQSERDTRRWRRIFARLGVSPVQLFYEDHLEHGCASTVAGILRSIGVTPRDVPPSDFQKQADALSDELVRRYREDDRTQRESAGGVAR